MNIYRRKAKGWITKAWQQKCIKRIVKGKDANAAGKTLMTSNTVPPTPVPDNMPPT